MSVGKTLRSSAPPESHIPITFYRYLYFQLYTSDSVKSLNFLIALPSRLLHHRSSCLSDIGFGHFEHAARTEKVRFGFLAEMGTHKYSAFIAYRLSGSKAKAKAV